MSPLLVSGTGLGSDLGSAETLADIHVPSPMAQKIGAIREGLKSGYTAVSHNARKLITFALVGAAGVVAGEMHGKSHPVKENSSLRVPAEGSAVQGIALPFDVNAVHYSSAPTAEGGPRIRHEKAIQIVADIRGKALERMNPTSEPKGYVLDEKRGQAVFFFGPPGTKGKTE